ncbi:isopentenyl transferase family protein [Amycolatopsis sp. NPDC059657]|uniref:isopentenyl transferase family protein n=1 Tax=Amycolatopsis sp. NPDC059657 TaxID=3346899 RepID=UPI00366CEC1E
MASANCEPQVHVIAGPEGTGRSTAAGEFARATGAPVVVADRTQCYLDIAVTSARPQGDAVTRYFLAARQVRDGEFPAEVATSALLHQIEVLAGENPLVLVEVSSVSLTRGLAECRASLPFRFTSQVLTIDDPAAHVLHLRARALRMLTAGMLDEFALAWRAIGQRPFVSSISGLDALVRWCEEASVNPEDLASLPRDANLLMDIADWVAQAHLERGIAQEAAFSSLSDEQHAVNHTD